ncbi:MAG: aspartate/glutamate racemase family protein [Candidatus Neomarinimicrobiota bacterium]
MNNPVSTGRWRPAIAALIFILSLPPVPALVGADLPDNLYEKREVTILITDSGLGGISVAAYLEKGLRERPVFRKVRLVYASALPSTSILYNSMERHSEKVRVFDKALDGFIINYRPDVILIACNTLSVLYPETEFASAAPIPVISIVDFGVELMDRFLTETVGGSVIILGTETTIEQGTHRDFLFRLGHREQLIGTKACPMLESEIQSGPDSDVVRSMIEMFAWEYTATNAARGDTIGLGLCCTHYPYAADAFRNSFSSVLDRPTIVLDPNRAMAEALMTAGAVRFKHCRTTVEVVSRAEIPIHDRQAIAAAVRPISVVVSEHLVDYKLNPELFSYP